MAANGTYKNPAEKPCWTTCGSCGRCKRKQYGDGIDCYKCSARFDPEGRIDEDHKDFCDCVNGWLRWKTKTGRMLYRKYDKNPFKGTFILPVKSEDERDWDSYLNEQREKMDNEHWNPIKIVDD